jgi:two-component system OmpR family sensor kinase
VSRLPIRLRLTLFSTAAMALVLAGAAWLLYLQVGSDLGSGIDQSLRSRAQDVGALVRDGGSLRSTSSPLIERGESFAELVSPRGRVLDASSSLQGKPLLSPDELRRAREHPIWLNRSSSPGLDEPTRLLAVRSPRGVLVVGGTRENRAETLAGLRRAFFIGCPVALLLAALGGYLLAGAALRPMEAMRRRAQEISTSSLDERLPVPGTGDEVARLGETLNRMLERIEDGLARERRFVSDASHELRTPLAALRAELDLALARKRTPEELEGALRSAAEETERLSQLAQDLLVLARADGGKLPVRRERLAAAGLLADLRQRYARRAVDANRTLEVDADDHLELSVARLRTEQALGNLVENALRHGGGRILLQAHRRDGRIELHVRDEGPGFSSEFIDHAFDRFSRGEPHRPGSGTGLGLAIVEVIADAHGGAAHVANLDTGADAWLELPDDRGGDDR